MTGEVEGQGMLGQGQTVHDGSQVMRKGQDIIEITEALKTLSNFIKLT